MTHAVLSRSWLLAALNRGKEARDTSGSPPKSTEKEGEIIRWYETRGPRPFDVCADDPLPALPGITKIVSEQAGKAVRDTRGKVITRQGEICDARYSKACGGLTEDFGTAWGDQRIPYLTGISDAPMPHQRIATEEERGAGYSRFPTPTATHKTRDFSKRSSPRLTARPGIFPLDN